MRQHCFENLMHLGSGDKFDIYLRIYGIFILNSLMQNFASHLERINLEMICLIVNHIISFGKLQDD